MSPPLVPERRLLHTLRVPHDLINSLYHIHVALFSLHIQSFLDASDTQVILILTTSQVAAVK